MKKTYKELQEKYSLPSYEELNKDFDIYSISKEDDLIKEIIKKIEDVLETYVSLLEDIIQPDSRYYILKEANVLDAKTRKKVNQIYAKLLYLNRFGIEIDLDYSEEKAIEYIKITNKEWQELKKEILPIIKTLKESWANQTETKNEGGYFG